MKENVTKEMNDTDMGKPRCQTETRMKGPMKMAKEMDTVFTGRKARQ